MRGSALSERSSKSACAFPATSSAALVLASSRASFSFSFRSRSLSTSACAARRPPGRLSRKRRRRALLYSLAPLLDMRVIQALTAQQRPPLASASKLVVLLDDRQLVRRGEGPPLRPVSPRTPRGGHQAILPHGRRHVCNGQCHVSRQIPSRPTGHRDLLHPHVSRESDERELREAEWVEHPEIAPGYAGTLAAITRQVIAKRDRYGWLPILPSESKDLPMSRSDILDLHALLAATTPDREARRQQRLPDLGQLPPAEAFSELVSAAQRYEQMAADTGSPGRTLVALGGEVLTEVASHLEKAATALTTWACRNARPPGIPLTG